MHLPPRSGLLLESALGTEKEPDHSDTATFQSPCSLKWRLLSLQYRAQHSFWGQSWLSLSEYQGTRMHRWLRTASIRLTALSPWFSVPRVSSEHSCVLRYSVFPLEQKSALVTRWRSYDPKMLDGHSMPPSTLTVHIKDKHLLEIFCIHYVL